MVGADTSDFYPALENADHGLKISQSWSRTARRLNDEFKVSVGFMNGKRCLGGMLELMMHCHYLISVDDARFGMPEVTLPVVPGMEGCHWPFRKTSRDNWPKLLEMLLGGRFIRAKDAAGWLLDYAGPMDEAIKMAWKVASGSDHEIKERKVVEAAITDIPTDFSLPDSGDEATEAARQAIMECITQSCGASLTEALELQAQHSAAFMSGNFCQKGAIGTEASKVMAV
jgi:enoyl-CoA hydratase/carnithine racemase